MNALVSIVIANHNYGRFLGEAIESVQQQDWPAIEIIVVDDGSRDDSVEIACRYPVTVLAQENQGVSAARNNGAAQAKGKYILFLDSDDRLFPGAIGKLVKLLEASGPGTGYAYGQLQYFDQRDTIFESRPFDPGALAEENYIQTSALMRRDVFDAIGGWDRGFALREDWELFIRFWHAGYSGAFLGEPHLYYRKHKPPTRKRTRVPKRIAITRLEFLYPRFFRRSILTHLFRHLWYRWRYRIGSDIRRYGPSEKPPRLVRSAP